MWRSILNSFSTAEIVLFSIGGMVVLTLVGVLLARRFCTQLTESNFEPIADSIRVVYELIFALILAFVIAAVLDEMGNAESAVATEANTIAELVRANDTFPEKVRGRLDDAVQLYVRAVATDEWKTMKDGEASPQAAAELEGVYAEYRTVEPKGAAQSEAYSQAIDNLDQVASQRRDRLDIASADLPTMLRVLVLVGVVLLLVLEYRPQLPLMAQLAFMGTLATVVTAAFLLTVVLNYPFAGDVSVANTPFKEDDLARFWGEELAYRPKPGDHQEPLTARRLEGVYNSDAFGTFVIKCFDEAPPHDIRPCRSDDRRMRAVYRYYDGTVTGEVVDGIFRGWWTQRPSRTDVGDAGRVELRLMDTSAGPLVAGRWSDLYRDWQIGWDLTKIGGDTPQDLGRHLHHLRDFREAPHAWSD
jgi:hypothetical protein